MQSNYAMPLTTCDQFKTAGIIDVINKLEKLTQIKNSILSNVSDKVNQRIERLTNIKSRLVRLKEMIKIVSMQSKTVTIKSRRNYPKKNVEIPFPVLTGEEIDMNTLRNMQAMDLNNKINTKCVFADPNNNSVESTEAKSYLKEAPSGSIDEAINMQIILNDCLKKYYEISRSIYEGRVKMRNYNQNEEHFVIDQNDKNSIYTLSNFSVINKKKIHGNIKKALEGEMVKIAETEAMVAFNKRMQEMEEKKNKKKREALQEAPVSIATNKKLEEYNSNKVNINLNNTETNIEVDLPEELNLGNVAVIEREQEETNSNPEETKEENQNNEIDDIFNKEEGIEIVEEDEPIDWMKDKIERDKTKALENPTPQNNQTQNTTTNSNPSSAPTPPPAPPKSNAPLPPGVPPPPPIGPLLELEKKKAEARKAGAAPPKAPSQPSAPQNKEIKEESKAEEEKKEEGAEEPKESQPELSMEEQLKAAMGGLKKVGETQITDEAPPRELSMEEQIKAAMGGLKKVGETQITDEVKPKELSMQDQINAARGKLKKVGEVETQKESSASKPAEDPNKGLSLVRIFFNF
ncbi:MAG: hypothetical protein MJ252_14995 [archaeon]|nr:hypothetical protein [archaeon]